MIFVSILLIILIMFLVYAFIPSYLNKRKFFRREKSKEKVIYLTFDDGPSQYTNELLDLLKKYNIRATFFCVANFAKERKDIIERMKHDSHEVALHSLKHKNSMLQGICETKYDVEQSLKIMNDLGIQIKFYRPPWGDSNLYLMKKLKKENLRCIWWDIMAGDWAADVTSDIIAQRLLSKVNKGDIICLHDGRGKCEAPLKTIHALEKVIPVFLEKGYEFKTIDEYKV